MTSLAARIREELERDGPMTFARFMELALYEPADGYYRQASSRPTREGDFLTAPELHPIFGWTLARELDRLWSAIGSPDPFRLIEFGASSGSLALALIEGFRRAGSALAEVAIYEPTELNEHRLAELGQRFEHAGLADRLRAGPAPTPGIVLANEFLDALPVHRVECRHGELRELYVTIDDIQPDRLVELAGPPSTSALAERLAADEVALAEGQRAEICLGLEPWLDEVDRRLERGLVLVIDYGHEAAELYGPRRFAGTLLAYSGHRVVDDPFVDVGRQDLTAHVDFTAVRRLARAHGFEDLGLTTHRELLVAAGLGDVLNAVQRDPATTLSEYTLVRSAIIRLIDPRAMGNFKALLLGRELQASIRLAGA